MISLSLSLADSQLYQEYSEVVQNREILLSHTDSISISGDIRSSSSPNHSPKLSHRPLPPLPQIIHHTLPLTNTFKSLTVPQKSLNRPPSPHLSISASSPTLWQELPGVRNSPDFGELNEDARRLQEVELFIQYHLTLHKTYMTPFLTKNRKYCMRFIIYTITFWRPENKLCT